MITTFNEENGILQIKLTKGSIYHFNITSIASVQLEKSLTAPQNLIVKYKQTDNQGNQRIQSIGNLNTVKAIDRVGDNLVILYSDPQVRDRLTIGRTPQVDFYYLPYTDQDGTYYSSLKWINLGPVGGSFHVYGNFSGTGYETPENAIDTLNDQYPNGLSGDQAGWIVSVIYSNDTVGLYAYDYTVNPHTWYALRDNMDATVSNITVVTRDSDNNGQPSLGNSLNINGLWFVETMEDGANGRFRYN